MSKLVIAQAQGLSRRGDGLRPATVYGRLMPSPLGVWRNLGKKPGATFGVGSRIFFLLNERRR